MWDITGPAGGPFANGTLLVVLRNVGSQPATWEASSVPAFVELDQQNGVIDVGSQVTVAATLLPAVAAGLPSGTYAERLTFREPAVAQSDVGIDCTLSVLVPGLLSRLGPVTDFNSQGAAAGPFLPASTVYTLTNIGTDPLEWEAVATDPWITLVPSTSVLAPSDSVDVTLTIDEPGTASLATGFHNAVVEWRDVPTSAVLHARVVSLNVLTDSSSAGWTALVPSADSRLVYVSSSTGDDANDGLSALSAVSSIAAGKALLRDGYPDWLLLRRGDAWAEHLGNWGISGRSTTERLVVTGFGPSPERPLLRTGTGDGFVALDGTPNDNVALVGLHLFANGYDGSQGSPRGILLAGGISNFLIEDCCIEGFETNVVIQGVNEFPAPTGRHKHIAVRRNVIVDAYTTGPTNAQGIYVSGTDGLLIEENVLDRNGWRGDILGSEPTWFRHNIYVQNLNTSVVVRGNIVARTDGIHVRSGGLVEDNLVLKNALGIVLGVGGFPAIETDGVSVIARRNVVLDGNNLQPGSPRGWGLWMANVRVGLVDSNVIANNVSGHAPYPVVFDVAVNGRGVENTVFSNNVVYNWNGYTRIGGTALEMRNIHLNHNRFQNEYTADTIIQHDQPSSTLGVRSANNIFYSLANPDAWIWAGSLLSLPEWQLLVLDTTSVAQQAAFPDSSRTVATYHASLGGDPSLEGFLTEARKQSRATWRTQYTAEAVNEYIRAGFGL